jgi:hypothetical protein
MSVSATLELGQYRKGRVWIGEVPDACFIPISTVNLESETSSSVRDALRVGAVEVLIPTGARFLYGLVGGTFKPDVTGKLCVDVGISPPGLGLLKDNLAVNLDKVHKGLSRPYAEAVVKGIEQELSNWTSGYLNVNCGANSDIGSAEVVFKYLGTVLSRLFTLGEIAPSGQQLADLFPPIF